MFRIDNKPGYFCSLISNVPHPTRQNSTSHFVTQISTAYFKGYWEVALIETDFEKSWYNVPEHPEQARNWVITRDVFALKDPDSVSIQSMKEVVPHSKRRITNVFAHQFGNYEMKTLVNEINKRFTKVDENNDTSAKYNYGRYKRWTRLYRDDQNLICTLFVGTGDIVFFSSYLAGILRLDQCEGITKFGKVVEFRGPRLGNTISGYNDVIALDKGGAYNPVIQAQYGNEYAGYGVPVFPSDTSSIYIYSNIVDYELVGNIETKLLRRVQANGVFGDHIEHRFSYPLYKKLAYDRLQEIEIMLCNDQGEPIKFEYGHVAMTLHFRQVE